MIKKIFSVIFILVFFSGIATAEDACVTFAPESSFYSNIYPRAFYYNGSTYLVFAGTDYNPYIIRYLHSHNVWSDPVQLGTSDEDNDTHLNPAILIKQHGTGIGTFHVLYGSHNSAGPNYAHATDYRDWTAESDLHMSATYPQMFEFSDGTMYAFFRGDDGSENIGHKGDWMSYTSSDNGQTWINPTRIMDATDEQNSWYCYFVKRKDNSIGCASVWEDQSNSGNLTNAYYLYMDSGGVWRNIEGTDLTSYIKLNKLNADTYCRFIDSGGTVIKVKRPRYDSSNNVFIPVIDYASLDLDVYYYDSGWQSTKVCDQPATYSETNNAFDMYIDDNDNIYLYTSTDGYNIKEYVSIDGGASFSETRTIVTNIEDRLINHIVIVDNFDNQIKLVFQGRKSGRGKVYAWGEGGLRSTSGLIIS